MEIILDFVQNAGFAAVVAFWSMKSMQDNNKYHYDEMKEITKELTRNTEAITRLCDRIDLMEGFDNGSGQEVSSGN